LEDTCLLTLLLTRSELSPQEIFAKFEEMRRDRVEAIVEAGRRQKNNKTQVSTIGMWIRNTFISILFRTMGPRRLFGKAWCYRIDWDEPNVEKVVKWWKDGKLSEKY
jgi:hypothetical protein